MSADRKTILQWVYYLETPDAELTLSEFMALVLVHIRENVKDSRAGTQHLEGMVGSLDEFLASTNEVYQALASQRTKPAPGVLPEGRP